MTNVCKEFAEFELRKLIGPAAAELEAVYSISYSQGDHVSYKGHLHSDDLLIAITTILSNNESPSKRIDAKMLATANNWLARLDWEMSCSVDRSCMSLDWNCNNDIQDLLPSNDLAIDHVDSVITEEMCENIEREIIDICSLIAEKIREAASSAYSKLSEIYLNLYDTSSLKRSYRTKNFVVEIHEMHIESIDALFGYEMGGIEYDEYLHEAAKKIATGENRAFDLAVKVFVVVNGDMKEVGSSCVGGIIEDAKAKPGGHLLRDIASEAIAEARSYLKSIQEIAA